MSKSPETAEQVALNLAELAESEDPRSTAGRDSLILLAAMLAREGRYSGDNYTEEDENENQ